MICLKCKNDMKKTLFDGVLVDYCPECLGFWLDGGEFESILKDQEANIQELWRSAKKEESEEGKYEPECDNCPKCISGHIVQDTKDGVEIDVCDSCNGIFFDKGELEKCLREEKHSWLVKIFDHVKNLW